MVGSPASSAHSRESSHTHMSSSVCTTTKEILDADLAEMSRADGQSFAALVKQENERLGLSGRETPLFFGTPSREMSPVPFEEYQSQPGTSDGKS